jgi:FixJ family two-component response regulator
MAAYMPLQGLPTGDLFIVDDDALMRDALSLVFTRAGYRVLGFADAAAFLATARDRAPVCVLLDLHLPDKSGLEVLKEVDARNYPAPIFIVTGDNDVGCAVEAVKNGAFDYLVKPFDPHAIVMRVSAAIALSAKCSSLANGARGRMMDFPGQKLLTRREYEVLTQIAAGSSNKEVGRHLGISPRTVEVHRARIMEKIGARNGADLVRIVLGGGNGRTASPEMVI